MYVNVIRNWGINLVCIRHKSCIKYTSNEVLTSYTYVNVLYNQLITNTTSLWPWMYRYVTKSKWPTGMSTKKLLKKRMVTTPFSQKCEDGHQDPSPEKQNIRYWNHVTSNIHTRIFITYIRLTSYTCDHICIY